MTDNYHLKKKQKNSILNILIAIILIVPICSCKSNISKLTTDRILNDISEKHKRIESYKADFTMKIIKKEKEQTLEGKIKFKQPNLTKQETNLSFKGEKKDLLVSNGKVKWMYIPLIKIAFREDLKIIDREFQKKYGITSAYVDMANIRYVKTDNFNGHQVCILEGMPNKLVKARDSEAPYIIRVFIDAENGVVRKVSSYDKQGEEIMSQVFRNFEFNIRIPDDEFIFEPPEGTQVIDTTEGTIRNLDVQ
ncbi:MAG: hypothetical protein KJ593_02780 [Candidatus Omnitrophica bacterium]|nr:hypothetical protein [Candidatus Omnitrophota bacterium]